MKDNTKKPNQKEHADFQDSYRRSSNFPNLGEDETDKLAIKGDGDLKVKEDTDDATSKTDSEKIKDAMDAIKGEEE